ncbi:hypothetical protein AM571_PC00548 (plasmid) [Rhizobium etli 8C-3]|uniref:Uncharacterized protein n=1 Tax=Rhizobium etli 8C-3 TaxID=538025 RepID=A0A1L5PE45_RHIET|nr:hypothetical protein AM571_PC00548 [Rhizobium etli 8C-3]
MGVRKLRPGQKICSIRVMMSANFRHCLMHQNHCMASFLRLMMRILLAKRREAFECRLFIAPGR